MGQIETGDQRLKKGEATRIALRSSIIKSISLHGLVGTTLSSVAEIAQVSRALVGFHFKTKDQLLMEALEGSLLIYDQSVRQELAGLSSPIRRLEAIMVFDVRFPIHHPDVISLWCAIWGEAKSLDFYRKAVLPVDRSFLAEVEDMFFEALGDRKEARRRAVICQTFTFGAWVDYHIDPDSYDADEREIAARTLVRFLTRPLAA